MTKPTAEADIRARTWRGDARAIAEAAVAYGRDPMTNFVRFISVLYSFRRLPECRRKLIVLRPQIRDWAEPKYLREHSTSLRQAAQRADILCAVLVWVPAVSPGEHADFCDRVLALGYEAMSWIRDAGPEGMGEDRHTWLLLALSLAQVMLERNDRDDVFSNLAYVSMHVHEVNDPRQKVRIYRKLGRLQLEFAKAFGGLGWRVSGAANILRSLLYVRGVPWNVHRETLRLIFGKGA